MTTPPLRRALLSVSDKSGLVELAAALHERGVELVSTGGSAAALRDAGLPVRDVANLTGFPEMMDGRVKTLHPAVHGGLLALRDNPTHLAAMEAHEIGPIDLLVCNLYPFEATRDSGAPYETCVENIDIGGPAMIRAAAKNHRDVTVVVDTEDYGALLEELSANNGATRPAFRAALAQTAYARTAAYDSAVSNWLAGALEIPTPRRVTVAGTLSQPLRYGENPHQSAAFYTNTSSAPGGLANARQVQGKALSYNNINDTDAAYELVNDLPANTPACAIIKHANPCGVASAPTLGQAYERAFQCDQTSAFGGIIAFNRPLDGATAERVTQIFTEVVIAPDADDAALAVFARKKNLRLLLCAPEQRRGEKMLRQVSGGFLWQDADCGTVSAADLRVVTRRTPDAEEMADLLFAWNVAKHVKSNAIVYVNDQATVGIGAGQMSRVDSARIAAQKSADMAEALALGAPLTQGSVVASDAFFPFADGLLAAASAGARAVIQPGGSMRDEEVIAAADEAGLAMVFTGMRHFRH